MTDPGNRPQLASGSEVVVRDEGRLIQATNETTNDQIVHVRDPDELIADSTAGIHTDLADVVPSDFAIAGIATGGSSHYRAGPAPVSTILGTRWRTDEDSLKTSTGILGFNWPGRSCPATRPPASSR